MCGEDLVVYIKQNYQRRTLSLGCKFHWFIVLSNLCKREQVVWDKLQTS